MENLLMRLIGLKIEKLYGIYDYNVKFNDDVTFIYGSNGSGKTTVLNITEYIITGRLHYLFNYDFKKIILEYKPIKFKNGNTKEINIEKQSNSLELIFNSKKYTIKREDVLSNDLDHDDLNRLFFRKYPVLDEIKSNFNYIYLPLNRKIADFYNYEYRRSRVFYNSGSYDIEDFDDLSMNQVMTLVKNHYRDSTVEINRINDNFRNEVLSTSFDILQTFQNSDFLEQLYSSDVSSDIKNVQKSFIKTAREFELIREEDIEQYDLFFDNYIENISSINKNNKKIEIDLIVKFQEIERIKKIVELSNKMQKDKDKVLKPINTFLETINSFIGGSDDGKSINISRNGTLFFTTKYNNEKIEIEHLSSGEKQLVIFFANLIFGLKNNKSGIFVVDEPEMSLHLKWQNNFVKKALEINKNIQLIFATHSPEFVGSYSKKMFNLKKEYVG